MESVHLYGYCGDRCSERCYNSHRRIHYCHDARCKGYPPATSRGSNQHGYTRGHIGFSPLCQRSSMERGGNFCCFGDPQSRFQDSYPRGLLDDAYQQNLAKVHGLREPGQQYGYDTHGGVVILNLGEDASNPHEPSRRDSQRRRHRPAPGRMYTEGGSNPAYRYPAAYQAPLSRQPSSRDHENDTQRRPRSQDTTRRAHGDEGRYRDEARYRDEGRYRDKEVRERGKPRSHGVMTPHEIESPQPSPKKKSVEEEKEWEIETIVWKMRQL